MVAQIFPHTQGRGERGCAGGLGEGLGFLKEVADGGPHLIVADEDEVVESLPENALRHHEGLAGGQSAGEGMDGRGTGGAGLPGLVGGGGSFCADADDADGGVDGFGGQTRAGCAAAAADGHDNHVDIRLGLQNFQRVRADAADEGRFVAGGNEAQSLFPLEHGAMAFAGFEVGAVEDDVGAIAAHGIDFDRVGSFGDNDDRVDAEELGGVGNGLAVVAGGGGDDAGSAVLRRAGAP